ncbi:MAG: hypothetical protein HYZ53_15835 [Planctomycetes bacterium]|nr:hypothetical protein [Planctomycetota bacterium]
MRAVAIVVLASLSLVPRVAYADYDLPKAEERYFLLADEWELASGPVNSRTGHGGAQGRAAHVLRTQSNRSEFEWPIDLFWLADRVDSDSICTGTHLQRMEEYLAGLQGKEGWHDSGEGGPRKCSRSLLVEVVSTKKGGVLFVAGIWILDPQAVYARACARGSDMLGADPGVVKAMGSAEALVAKMRAASDVTWKAMADRRRATIPPGPGNKTMLAVRQQAEVSETSVGVVLGEFLVLRSGDDVVAVRITERTATADGGARFEYYHQGDGSGDVGKPNVVRGEGEVFEKYTRLALPPDPRTGKASWQVHDAGSRLRIQCGPFHLRWSMGDWLCLPTQPGKDLFFAVTTCTKLSDVDVAAPTLTWIENQKTK